MLNTGLLRILADGEYHSGEELGALLGISRAAVWKQLQKLQDAIDIQFESVKGRGYRLLGGLDLLNRDAVCSAMSATSRELLGDFDLHPQLDSTNRLALIRAESGVGRGHVIVAEQQLAGRGRRGRHWVSPFGRNIYCSVVWEFDNGAAALEGLSLAVGIAVARSLKNVGVSDVGLKWPNDVVWRGQKLAGILLEMSGDAAGRCQVIIGIGINVSMRQAVATPAINQPWSDVSTAANVKVSRNLLFAGLLSELLPLLAEFEVHGFSRFRDAWSALDQMAGKPVTIHLGEQSIVGTAAGVGENGALAVDTLQGRQWFHGGEVSLRLRN